MRGANGDMGVSLDDGRKGEGKAAEAAGTDLGEGRGADIARRFDEAVFLIGVGLREKEEGFEDEPRAYTFSSSFRHGLDIFAALCVECAGERAASILSGLSESGFIRSYCSRDVSAWTEGWGEAQREAALEASAARYGPLALVGADLFVPTDECQELIVNAERDTVGAYQERRIYEYLREGTQEQYALGRRLLVRHPTISLDDYMRMRSGRYDFSSDPLDQGESGDIDREWLTRLLDLAYEPSPPEALVCPCCGWTLFLRGRQPYCSSPRCNERLPSDLSSLPSAEAGTMRLLRGAMRYLSAPGVLEVAVAELAKGLGLAFELWPAKDACDVLVTLPGGRRVAVDAKVYGSAARLAREVARDHGISRVEADEVVYVVPDRAESEQVGYCSMVNHSLRRWPGRTCMTLGTLRKRLGREVEEGGADGAKR